MRRIKKSGARAAICGLAWAFTAPAVAADWSDAYFGAILGSRSLEADWTTTDTRDPFGTPFAPTSATTESVTNSDTNVGIFAGYNWNLDAAWVAGAEADIELMENLARIDRLPGFGGDQPFPTTSFVEIRAADGFSLRGRGGYRLTPELLVYATTGLAWINMEIITTCPGDAGVCFPLLTQSFRNAEKMRGKTIGIGVEYALGSSLLRAGYRRSDFGDFNFTATPVIIDFTAGAEATLNVKTSIFQIGVVNNF